MAELSIPYALHYPSGSNRSPEEVQDGQGTKANVRCLGCKEMLVHRRASHDGRRRAHYAHMSISKANIQHCRESAIHALVKDIVADLSGTTLTLPNWHGKPITFTPIEGETEAVGVVENRIPDVIIRNSIGQMLAVEVFFSNRKTSDVIADYRRARLPTLELSVTLEDAYIEKGEVIRRLSGETDSGRLSERIRNPRSKWLVRPIEPFDSASPPYSPISKEYLHDRCVKGSNTLMTATDFTLDKDGYRQAWSISKGELTCWIDDYSNYVEEPSITFRIGTETWHLTTNQLTFMFPCDALEPSAKIFKTMQDLLLSRSKSTGHPTQWEDHYQQNKKGNWVSRTAVRGTTITAFKMEYGDWWRFCVSSKTWVIWGKHRFDNPISARIQAEDLAATFKTLRIPSYSARFPY